MKTTEAVLDPEVDPRGGAIACLHEAVSMIAAAQRLLDAVPSAGDVQMALAEAASRIVMERRRLETP